MIDMVIYQNIMAVMELIKNETDPTRQKAAIESGFNIFWDGIRSESANEHFSESADVRPADQLID